MLSLKSNSVFAPLYWFILVTSIIGVFMSSSWFIVWVWLEINMVSVIPLIVGSSFNAGEVTSGVTYFLVQAVGSLMILIPGIMAKLSSFAMMPTEAIASVGIMAKLGLAPVHLWVILVAENLIWWKLMLILVVQKLAPVYLIFSTNNLLILGWFSTATAVLGAVAVLNQPKIKSLFAYSSISNTGWIALGATLSLASTVIFMVAYFLVSIVMIMVLNLVGLPRVFSSSVQQDWATWALWGGFMSFMGLPPMAGFAAKTIFMVPVVSYSTLFVCALWFSVVMSAAAYLTASLGALFITIGTASWMHGFRPTLVFVGLLLAVLTSVVWGGWLLFLF